MDGACWPAKVPPLRTITQVEFEQTIARHRAWLVTHVTSAESVRADLAEVDFAVSNLKWPAPVSLEQADFSGARLDGLTLPTGIDLRAADFTGASLRATDFSAANSLASAICRGIDATAANFSGRNLDNADFGPAAGWSQLGAARFTGLAHPVHRAPVDGAADRHHQRIVVVVLGPAPGPGAGLCHRP